MINLLSAPLIRAKTSENTELLSLPETLAALMADRVESFPALRPHQKPAWHCFLVQLGAIACHRAGLETPPEDATEWETIIRALTSEFPNDEPWQLIVQDDAKPAFMQPPVPKGSNFTGEVSTPDGLDMLITSKNHDLKQAVAIESQLDDWIFALVSLQTCEGYGGSGNQGIARMNGGSSSRAHIALSPMFDNTTAIRPGQRFDRDLTQLIARREEHLQRYPYAQQNAPALLWTLDWPENHQLHLHGLDMWFIEVCRRVRLRNHDNRMIAKTGTSAKARIDAKQYAGVTGDPWAPINVKENKALTLGEDGQFDYRQIVKLMFSPDWEPGLLAKQGRDEKEISENWLLVAQAIARGNSKTNGFRERVIPITGFAARTLMDRRKRLFEVAQEQIGDIKKVDLAVRNSIALMAAGGDWDSIKEDHYKRARSARNRLDHHADQIFFPSLWARFEESDKKIEDRSARKNFVLDLVQTAEQLLEEAMSYILCPSIRRSRAEARARREFHRRKRKEFPEYFVTLEEEDAEHVSG